MTTAKLLQQLPEGHGIPGKTLDTTYRDLTSGRSMGEAMLVVAIVQPVTTGQRRTAKGIKRHVGYEVVRFEPITDAEHVEQCRWALAKAYEKRTGGRQLRLEYDGASEIEKRQELFTAIDDWAAEQDPPKTRDGVTAEWREYIQPTEGATVPPLAHAPTQHLLEFAMHIGAVVDPKVADRPAIPEAEFMTAARPIDPADLFDEEAARRQAEEREAAAAIAADKAAETEQEPEGEPAEGSIDAAAEEAAAERGSHLSAV